MTKLISELPPLVGTTPDALDPFETQNLDDLTDGVNGTSSQVPHGDMGFATPSDLDTKVDVAGDTMTGTLSCPLVYHSSPPGETGIRMRSLGYMFEDTTGTCLSHGTEYTGSQYVARLASTSILKSNPAAFEVYYSTGLSLNDPYTPTKRFDVNDTKGEFYVPLYVSGGPLAVGASTTSFDFEVVKSDHPIAAFTSQDANGFPQFRLINTSHSWRHQLNGSGGIYSLQNSANAGVVMVEQGGAGQQDQLYLKADNTTGIRTNSPTESLDVNGTFRVRSIGTAAAANALGVTATGVLTTNVPGGGNGGAQDITTATGRLTLTSGDYVPISDQVAQSTLYYTGPEGGNFRTWLHDGASTWTEFNNAEISLVLSGLSNNTNYDVFLYNNGGTPTLELATGTKGVATQDGVAVKTGDSSRRYLGTIRATGATTTEDSEKNRYVANYNNAKNRKLEVRPGYNNDDSSTQFNVTSTSYAPIKSGDNDSFGYLSIHNEAIHIVANCAFNSPSGGTLTFGIGDTTSTATHASRTSTSGQQNYTQSVSYIAFKSPGAYNAYFLARVNTGSATIWADIVRLGGTADPSLTYMTGWIQC